MGWLVMDVGSSSVRALLLDDGLRPIEGGLAAVAHSLTHAADGTATLDPMRVQRDLEACLDRVASHPRAAEVRAVGMCTLVGNLLGVRADGHPCTPVYTYADTRSTPDANALSAAHDAAAVLQRTGGRPHSAYHPAKLAWLRRTDPALFGQVGQWLDLATWLYRQWFGRAVGCSLSVASWSGLLDRATATWDAPWLAALGLDAAALPTVSDFDAPVYGLGAAQVARWPMWAQVPWFLALGDGAAANLGSGATHDGQTALTLGTTGALRTVRTGGLPAVPPSGWGYRIDRAHHLLGGATSEGGNLFAWARQTLSLPDPIALERALAEATPDSHGLTVLPMWAGERSPGWRAEAVGTLHGLHLSTTPTDIVQALMESVALRLAQVAEDVGVSGAVWAGGGALTASPAWAHIVCNALNQPLHWVDAPEVSARGVALWMWRALDGIDPAAHPPHLRATLTPNPEAVARLASARGRQRRLYDALG